MLDLDPIKARAEAGWVIHPEDGRFLIAEVERLRRQVDCANSLCCQTLDCTKEAEMIAPNGETFCDDCWESKVGA